MKLLDDNSRAYALGKIADTGHAGQHAGDAPEDFLAQLRRQVEITAMSLGRTMRSKDSDSER